MVRVPEHFLPFALPDIGEEEIKEVVDCLRSGWVTTGPKVRQFEEEFAAFVGAEVEAVSVNSATAGLHLALEALGIGPGDEVITSPYTFTATAEVVRYLGADPVFVDIDPTTFNIDPTQIEAAISTRTRAIVPVHFAGLACDMDAILKIARRHGLKVVEDAAHALPASCKGNLIGALESDATVFSFYATKTITTGEGGMLVTRNKDISRRCRVMRLHGISLDAFDRYHSRKPAWQYEVIEAGFKYNMTDISAAIGIHQLRKAHAFQARRNAIAERYDAAFSGSSELMLPPHASTEDMHSWHLYVLRLNEYCSLERDEFIEKMAEHGIGCSVHFIPLHLHPYWRNTYKLAPADFPNAVAAYEKAVSLPIYSRMSDEDRSRVISAVHKVLAGQ